MGWLLQDEPVNYKQVSLVLLIHNSKLLLLFVINSYYFTIVTDKTHCLRSTERFTVRGA